MKKVFSSILILLFTSCSSASQFGAGVNITFDPRTIGMQIDDTIMQKNLSARLALIDKKYLKKYSLKDTVDLIFESEKVNKKEIYKLCIKVKNEKNC